MSLKTALARLFSRKQKPKANPFDRIQVPCDCEPPFIQTVEFIKGGKPVTMWKPNPLYVPPAKPSTSSLHGLSSLVNETSNPTLNFNFPFNHPVCLDGVMFYPNPTTETPATAPQPTRKRCAYVRDEPWAVIVLKHGTWKFRDFRSTRDQARNLAGSLSRAGEPARVVRAIIPTC